MKNSGADISEDNAIFAFIQGVRRNDLQEALGRENPRTIAHLMEIANKWADGEDSVRADRVPSPDDRQQGSWGRRGRNDRRNRQRPYGESDGIGQVAASFPDSRIRGNPQSGDTPRDDRGDRTRDDESRKREWKPRGTRREERPFRTPAE